MDERDKDRGRPPALRVVAGGVTPARHEEDALVAAFLVGDDGAFGELVRRNERLVLAIVRRYARAPDDAKDLAQRTFLRAFEAARRALRRGNREPVPFRRWLVRVAVNLAKNHVRDEARRARAPLVREGGAAGEPGARAEAELAADSPDPLAAIARAEQSARLHLAVLELPRRQREVLTLRIDAELPFAEIADALGITENAAKVTFHHATRRLRAALGGDEAHEEHRP
ncbi:MAG TPA: sigma-70 family RNA polymerase sigma factor [Anaeromyxobacter sp.]